jgi:D-serine dehydratase
MYTRFFERLRARTPEVADLGDGLRPALELWTYVQSRPEPGKVICTMGKRDVSYDAGLPLAQLWYRPGGNAPAPVVEGCTVTELNDQHTHMTVPPDSPFRVGDLVSFGISHPCTTFDKWQVMYVVDDDYNVVSALKTFF